MENAATGADFSSGSCDARGAMPMTTKTESIAVPTDLGSASNRGVQGISPTQIYRRASVGRTTLSQSERDRISPDQLFALMLTRRILLSARDRRRLRIVHLWQLALLQRIQLTNEERDRLSPDQLCRLNVVAAAAIGQA